MNAVDIFLIVLILLSAFIGYRYGALRLFFEWMKWAASAALAVLFYSLTVNEMVLQIPELSEWYVAVSIPVIFILLYLLLSGIQRFIISSTSAIHLFDKITGLIPGLLTGIVVIAITARLLTLSVFDTISSEAGKSKIAAALSPYTTEAEMMITPLLNDYLPAVVINNSNHTKNESTVYATAYFSVRPDLEYEMLLLVNAERKKQGLKLLDIDEELKKVARAHSADMLTRGYFSHMTPEGKDPFHRMKKAGITYIHAGENLAYASTLAEAHKGLMNSPSHRAAILNKTFGRIGIGIVDGGKNGLMISQEFRD
jgi:uncharacterized protein YkwD